MSKYKYTEAQLAKADVIVDADATIATDLPVIIHLSDGYMALKLDYASAKIFAAKAMESYHRLGVGHAWQEQNATLRKGGALTIMTVVHKVGNIIRLAICTEQEIAWALKITQYPNVGN